MQSVIVSLEYDTAFCVHILVQNPMQPVMTLFTDEICSPGKMKTVRTYLENHQMGDLAMWFKQEYSLTHSKITISIGPEIRRWLKNVKNKEKNNYEIQNSKNNKRDVYQRDNRTYKGNAYKSSRKF